MVACNIPFSHLESRTAAIYLVKGMRPILPEHCPVWLGKLVVACNAQAPEARPTFEEIDDALQGLAMVDENMCAAHRGARISP